MASAGEYPVPACVYLPATQCHPCTNHSECNTSVDGNLNRCVTHGDEGSFCATNCGPDGVSCPSGSSCQEIAGDQGEVVAVCMADRRPKDPDVGIGGVECNSLVKVTAGSFAVSVSPPRPSAVGQRLERRNRAREFRSGP